MAGTGRRRFGAIEALVVSAATGFAASDRAGAQIDQEIRPPTPVTDERLGVERADPFAEGAVYLEADEVVEEQETGRYIARGRVEARYGPRTLRADEVIYYPTEDRVLARGNVTVVQDDGVAIFADEIELAADLTTGVASEVGVRLPNNGTIGAAQIVRRSPERAEFERAFYTACEACDENGRERPPSWRLRARRIVQDGETDMIYYRDAVLEVRGVPVFYSPFFAHSDPTVGRHSGFMLPSLGESDALGTWYEQPYFWAISDHSDLTVAPRIMGNVNPLLGAEYRRRFHSGSLELTGTATFDRDVDQNGFKTGEERWRSSLFGSGAFRISHDWAWGFGIERVSDDYYVRRYDIDAPEVRRGIYGQSSQRYLSQLFAVGQSDDFYASAGALAFQSIRFNEDNDQIPLVLPVIEARRTFSEPLFGGSVEARATAAFLERNGAADSRRISFALDWRRPVFHSSGIVVTPFALARADVYNVADFTNPDGELINDTFARGLGHIGTDFRYPLGRSLGAVDVVIEPYVSLVYSPEGGNSQDIPNEDALPFDFDESSLVDVNRNGGFDQWEDGARATVGGRAMALWGEGGEASIFLGQIYRAHPSNEFDEISGLAGSTSDVVGSVRFNVSRNTGVSANFRLDEDNLDLQRFDIDAHATVGPVYVSASYLDVEEALNLGRPLESGTFETRVQLTERIGAFTRLIRNFDTDVTTRSVSGLYYNDECLRIWVSYENDNVANPEFQEGDSFRVFFTLATLGSYEPS